MRPPREAYVRAVVKGDGVEYILGVELRSPDEFEMLRARAERLMRDAITYAPYNPKAAELTLRQAWARAAFTIEMGTIEEWPDRAYFLEVGDDDHGWVQIFQPWEARG